MTEDGAGNNEDGTVGGLKVDDRSLELCGAGGADAHSCMSVAPVFVVGEYRLVVVPALAPIVETFVGLIEGVVVVVGAFPRFFGFVPGVETS